MTRTLALEFARRFQFHENLADKQVEEVTVGEAIDANDREERLFEEMIDGEIEQELLSR